MAVKRRDICDAHENCPISKTPQPCSSSFEIPPLNLRHPISNDPPPLQMITNHLKESIIQGWLFFVINKVTTQLFIISNYYYWHFLEWGIGQDICNGYGRHHIVFIILFARLIFSFLVERVEQQESVDLAAFALLHIRIHAYDVCSWRLDVQNTHCCFPSTPTPRSLRPITSHFCFTIS